MSPANFILPRLYGTSIVPPDGPCPCDYMLVGEAPGEEEDKVLVPFVGRAGKKLTEALNEAGLARRDVYVTNAVKCRPPANRTPKWDEIQAHRPSLQHEISICQPKAIITLGTTATRAILGWEKLPYPLIKLRYTLLYRINPGTTRVFVTYHPAACFYGANIFPLIVKDLQRSVQWVNKLRS